MISGIVMSWWLRDAGMELTTAEQREAEGLVDLAELLTLLATLGAGEFERGLVLQL
jgi:hypothetical protein